MLWSLLRHFEIPVKTLPQVVHGSKKTEPLSMRIGVRQGYVLSPLLYLVALDYVTRGPFLESPGKFSGP